MRPFFPFLLLIGALAAVLLPACTDDIDISSTESQNGYLALNGERSYQMHFAMYHNNIKYDIVPIASRLYSISEL